MKRLTKYKREQIAVHQAVGLSVREIARKIGRDHSVVSREIRRNKGQLFPYEAASAQYFAERRAKKTNVRKLRKEWRLRLWVEGKLLEQWSPEQIAGRLKSYPPPELKGVRVSHEAIYAWIYAVSPIGAPWLFHQLRRKHPERRRKLGRKRHHQVQIPQLVSIWERPETVEPGHFEADSVVGKRHKAGLSVHYERKTQYTRIHHLTSLKAEETRAAVEATLADLPVGFAKSITFDRGSETTLHHTLREPWNVQTYHCDPYAPYQKGGVEQVNGLIRQYFPKGTDFRYIDPSTVATVEHLLNTRPRKKLNYLTPHEALAGALNS